MRRLSFKPMRRPVAWLAVLSLLVFVSALAACGGDSAASTSAKNDSSASTSNTTGNMTGNTTTGSTGSTSPAGSTASAMTITIKESRNAAGKDVFTFDHPAITLKKGDTVTIVNQSDDDQDFDEGDAAKAGVDVIIPGNHSGTATFNNAGTFTIKSKAGASFTVTVS